MADVATLQQWLADGEKAYHDLMTGKSLVRIQHGDRDMTFSQANASQLAAYLADLRSQLAALGVATSGPRRGRARAIYF
jgi:hypothetical protein